MGKICYFQCDDTVAIDDDIRGMCLYVDSAIKNYLPQPQRRQCFTPVVEKVPHLSTGHCSFINNISHHRQQGLSAKQLLANLLEFNDVYMLNISLKKKSGQFITELCCQQPEDCYYYFKVISDGNGKVDRIRSIDKVNLSEAALSTMDYNRQKTTYIKPR